MNKQKSASLKYEKDLNILFFTVGRDKITLRLPKKITEIKSIDSYEDGFLTIETNYGEEYLDYQEWLEAAPFLDEKYKQRLKSKFNSLRLEDISIGGIE